MKNLYNKFEGNNNVVHFTDKKSIINEIKSIKEPCAILLKGSRGMKLEEIIEE